MYIIELTERTLVKNPNTKTTYVTDKIEKKIITDLEYNLLTKDNVLNFFVRLGGTESKQKGYTIKGYVCTKLTSLSPDKKLKIIREFQFKEHYESNR